jgi:hypothetical protein
LVRTIPNRPTAFASGSTTHGPPSVSAPRSLNAYITPLLLNIPCLPEIQTGSSTFRSSMALDIAILFAFGSAVAAFCTTWTLVSSTWNAPVFRSLAIAMP